ncbi:MAG TPA: tail fiber domain-containing protein [Bacteroidales bacterium]|nr:tail fiber domain-containing protein [Bacteroidales bacterium]HOM41519.1 tail fiber domain-containing protein [Bacteroidales bacterium]HOU30920.1 tail fiber domain-containing protein [Bacteroidales bacterium]HQG56534.1 tail fiber domain-containing protein [Bacteroidales bacterium]HQK71578.1 tail fiber domain-containing protein [Bacteroidales bacterium]
MKTRFLFSFILTLSSALCALSQTPQGFNYQAIARDGATGNPIINQSLPVRLTIQSDSLSGIIWQEVHASVTTNSFGLFNVIVGKGTRQASSTVPKFSDIDWKVTPRFIMTEVYYDGEWKLMGSSRLWSVPYSMTAAELTGSVKKLTVAGETSNMEEALFEVKNKEGKTVFAVYNEGVRVYVDDGISGKGVKGGFAIGSFDSSKGIYQDYFIVTPDSIRAYINTDTLKGVKGGFAIGGFDPSKAVREEFLRVTRDSTRVYLNNTGTKGRKGGFAIGSFDDSKGGLIDYMLVSRDSIRLYIKEEQKGVKGGFAIGSFDDSKAGKIQYLSVSTNRTNVQVKDTILGFSVTNVQSTGAADFMRIDKLNAFIGHETGVKVTPSSLGSQGKYNVFLGYQSGNSNTEGYRNVFMGYRSGMKNTIAEDNVFIGTETGINNQTGNANTFIGYRAGFSTTTSENTFVGHGTGYYNESGKYNTFLGKGAGSFHESGDYNVFLGWGAGNNNGYGSKNVFIGAGAGNNNSGSSNIIIGFSADVSGSNNLWINNGFSTTPLISGNFSTRKVIINGKAGDFTDPGYEFYVVGDAGGSTPWSSLSDERLKTNIIAINDALNKVTRIRGVSFDWIPEAGMDEKHSVGIIAQELQQVMPEAVKSSGKYLSVQYGLVSALLVEAIKEQQKIIDDQKKQISELNKKLGELQITVEEMKNVVNVIKSNNY